MVAGLQVDFDKMTESNDKVSDKVEDMNKKLDQIINLLKKE